MKTAVLNKPYYDEEGFDTYVLDDDKKLYAIFDGMGISEGARKAARYCRDSFEKATIENAAGLARLIDEWTEHMRGNFGFGGTTAVMVHIRDDGTLEYALCGDSRLYIHESRGKVMQYGHDEGMGNLLNNYIGQHGKGCQQWGIVSEWEKFMICSDGITGDWPEQFIDDEVINTLGKHELPEIICQRLTVVSRKPDDKTIIVGVR